MIGCGLLLPRLTGAQSLRNVFVPYSDQLKHAAESGDPESQTALAVTYLQADGTQRDVVQAVHWLQEAYKQGEADAAAWLGSLYLAGQGVPLNISKGLTLIKEAQDDGSAVGTRFAAAAAEKGIGQPRDKLKALELYEIAAIHLDPVARDRMGLAYESGLYRSRNLDKAAALYDQAAKAGYSWAQLHLGELYASNLSFMDTRENRAKESEAWLPEAYAMYIQSAKAGNRVGAYRAAQALAQGTGVDQNLSAAEELFKKSIRQNYGPAQEALADMYAQHPELGHTKIDEYVLLKRAVAKGQQSARSKIKTLEQSMSPDEVKFANEHVIIAQSH